MSVSSPKGEGDDIFQISLKGEAGSEERKGESGNMEDEDSDSRNNNRGSHSSKDRNKGGEGVSDRLKESSERPIGVHHDSIPVCPVSDWSITRGGWAERRGVQGGGGGPGKGPGTTGEGALIIRPPVVGVGADNKGPGQ
eukprot:2824216-Pyramimonas_sp.AAC.2